MELGKRLFVQGDDARRPAGTRSVGVSVSHQDFRGGAGGEEAGLVVDRDDVAVDRSVLVVVRPNAVGEEGLSLGGVHDGHQRCQVVAVTDASLSDCAQVEAALAQGLEFGVDSVNVALAQALRAGGVEEATREL